MDKCFIDQIAHNRVDRVHSHTFEGWMARVNAHLAKKVGMISDDLPDCCYRDWFDSKVSPSEAARMAIAEAKGY